jgi:hypothetical protein
MAAFPKYIAIFVISMIFAISLLTFIYQIEVANNAPQTIFSSPSMSGLNNVVAGNLSVFNNNVAIQQNASLNEQVNPPTGAFILYSILTSIGKFIILPITFTNALFSAIATELGISPLILDTIASLILLIGIFLWYKTVKTAD